MARRGRTTRQDQQQSVTGLFQQYSASPGRAGKSDVGRRDKLLQTKLREKEIKEAHRLEIQAEKVDRLTKRNELRETLRAERLCHDTKRAARDRRHAEKRAEKARNGQECEHGVWRCKICYPHVGK
jgi:hypothetical protein